MKTKAAPAARDDVAKTASMKAELERARKTIQPLAAILQRAEPSLSKAHDAVFERFLPGKPKPVKKKTRFEELARCLGVQCEAIEYELRTLRERIVGFENLMDEALKAENAEPEKRNP